MKKIGFDLEADGVYGQRSRDVCKTFQRRVDLPDDGIVGQADLGGVIPLHIVN